MPTRKLTKMVVERLPLPECGQTLLFDSELRGFGVRLSTGTRSFFVERRVSRKTRRVTLGRYPELTVVQARTRAQKVLGQMAAGTDPNAEKKEAKTKAVLLQQVFQDFKQARKDLKPRTLTDYERVMSTGLADWLDKPWTSITGDMALRRHTEIGGERGAALANKCGRVLRAVMNFAIAKYRDGRGQPLVLENPVARISQTRAWYKVERRTNYIKPHQLPAWFAAVNALGNETVRDYLIFVLFTGLRRNEAERLRWDDVDFDDRSFLVRDPTQRTGNR